MTHPITRCTVHALLTGLTKAQKERLRKCGYTDDDFSSPEKFYEALGECPGCRLKEHQMFKMEQDMKALECNRKYFDDKFDELAKKL